MFVSEVPKSALSFFQNSFPFSVMSGAFSSLPVPLSFRLSHHSLTVTHLHCQGRITPGQAIFSSASVGQRNNISVVFFLLVCLVDFVVLVWFDLAWVFVWFWFLAKHLYHLLSLLLNKFYDTHWNDHRQCTRELFLF